jgi:hypothetical protein
MNNVEKMDINQLIKADWNYKTDGTDEQISKLMKSIQYDNSAGVLAVRRVGDKYEVIDGNHRLEALKRLGWTEIQVENFGDLPKSKAIIVARRRNHVWFDDDIVSFGKLLKEEVLPEIDKETLKSILPDSAEEIDGLLNFNEMEWQEPELKVGGEEDSSNGNKISLVVSDEVFDMWNTWRNKMKELNNYDAPASCFEYAIVEALNSIK